MKPAPLNLISSGVEPVDELLGGLVRGHLYLVHGESSGKALFGIKFLIEGLKRGESGALVINYSPEDAIRRFARVGYDCRDDVFNGQLVILECASDLTRRVGKLREIDPVLAELKWLMGETHPNRLVFDSIAHLLSGDSDQLARRVREFVCWAERFGSTSLLITNGQNAELINFLKPHVNQSFRFEVKEDDERAVRYITFEKSKEMREHAIEVDPTRGIFLLGHGAGNAENADMPAPQLKNLVSGADVAASDNSDFNASGLPDLGARADETESNIGFDIASNESISADEVEIEVLDAGFSFVESNATPEGDKAEPVDRPVYEMVFGSEDEPLEDLFDSLLFGSEKQSTAPPAQPQERNAPEAAIIENPLQSDEIVVQPSGDLNHSEVSAETPNTRAFAIEEFLDRPEELQPADERDLAQARGVPREQLLAETPRLDEPREFPEGFLIVEAPRLDETQQVDEAQQSPEEVEPPAALESIEKHDVSTVANRNGSVPDGQSDREAESSPLTLGGVDPKSLRVLIIDGDPASLEILGRALSEYTVETAVDGVSGLLKLIQFKADLIIFDVDGPVVDGFTLLAQMRSSLQTPIIALSSAHVRSTDRIQSAYLGADYYLTKPFSVIELRQKVRQLLARYLGIQEWITAPAATPPKLSEDRRAAAHRAHDLLESTTLKRTKEEASVQVEQRVELRRRDVVEVRNGADRRRTPSTESDGEQFIAYKDFTKLVEEKVNAAMVRGTAFSIVGCQLPNMTARGGDTATRLFGLIQGLVRSCDCISLNEKRDFVVLLSDADTAGAKAFINRLTNKVKGEMSQEPTIWVRSFPDYEN